MTEAEQVNVLVSHIHRIGLGDTELERWDVGTIRLKHFKIGARVKRSVRRLIVKMANSYPWQLLYRTVAVHLATSGSSPLFSP